jgi:hypothetical protein
MVTSPVHALARNGNRFIHRSPYLIRSIGLLLLLLLAGATSASAAGISLTFTPSTRFETCSTQAAALLPLGVLAPGARTLGARHVAKARETIAVQGAVQQLQAPKDHAPVFHALTAAFLTLSVLDSYTTSVALKHGLQEKNPVIAPIASDSTTLYVTKTALAVTTIIAARHVWKANRVAGIVTMVAANANQQLRRDAQRPADSGRAVGRVLGRLDTGRREVSK